MFLILLIHWSMKRSILSDWSVPSFFAKLREHQSINIERNKAILIKFVLMLREKIKLISQISHVLKQNGDKQSD